MSKKVKYNYFNLNGNGTVMGKSEDGEKYIISLNEPMRVSYYENGKDTPGFVNVLEIPIGNCEVL